MQGIVGSPGEQTKGKIQPHNRKNQQYTLHTLDFEIYCTLYLESDIIPLHHLQCCGGSLESLTPERQWLPR